MLDPACGVHSLQHDDPGRGGLCNASFGCQDSARSWQPIYSPPRPLQPIPKEALLSGKIKSTKRPRTVTGCADTTLRPVNRAQCGSSVISTTPVSLYGAEDNFELESSSVLPALIRRFDNAKIRGEGGVVVWGTGGVRREYPQLYDLADACVFLKERSEDCLHINVGMGEDVTIEELAEAVRDDVYPAARIVFGDRKLDRPPSKLLDVSPMLVLGWRHTIQIHGGIAGTYSWSVESRARECALSGAVWHAEPALEWSIA